ncbi:DUF6988 family protein [Shewanella algae]|uniref:DUF6988 family protein n=1 Tax=Shewanella algae TaxID=38313 RepID=UPI001BF12874|nr:hypothetical protein [Shewanella algae]BCV61607.1 hypothetical protein TUM17386_12780 [Shewanella algae]
MNESVKKAYDLSVAINSALEGVQIPNKDSHFLPTLFHSTVIEHHRSIVTLIDKSLHGSASALVRPLFESYVKGLWFSTCASQSDFNKLRKDKFEKKFGDLVSDIDKVNNNGLAKPKKNYWPTLNSLTHSGAAQLGRKYSGDKITIIVIPMISLKKY